MKNTHKNPCMLYFYSAATRKGFLFRIIDALSRCAAVCTFHLGEEKVLFQLYIMMSLFFFFFSHPTPHSFNMTFLAYYYFTSSLNLLRFFTHLIYIWERAYMKAYYQTYFYFYKHFAWLKACHSQLYDIQRAKKIALFPWWCMLLEWWYWCFFRFPSFLSLFHHRDLSFCNLISLLFCEKSSKKIEWSRNRIDEDKKSIAFSLILCLQSFGCSFVRDVYFSSAKWWFLSVNASTKNEYIYRRCMYRIHSFHFLSRSSTAVYVSIHSYVFLFLFLFLFRFFFVVVVFVEVLSSSIFVVCISYICMCVCIPFGI